MPETFVIVDNVIDLGIPPRIKAVERKVNGQQIEDNNPTDHSEIDTVHEFRIGNEVEISTCSLSK